MQLVDFTLSRRTTGYYLSAAATITATAADDAARSLEISNLTSGAITDLLVSGTLAIGKSVTVNRGGELDVAAGGLFNQTNSAGIAIQSGAALSVQGILQASGGLSVVGSSSGLVSVSIGSGGTLDVGRTSGDSSLSFATVSLDGGTLLQGQGKLFIDAATTITSTANSVIGEFERIYQWSCDQQLRPHHFARWDADHRSTVAGREPGH